MTPALIINTAFYKKQKKETSAEKILARKNHAHNTNEN